jgi:hypothetical protein
MVKALPSAVLLLSNVVDLPVEAWIIETVWLLYLSFVTYRIFPKFNSVDNPGEMVCSMKEPT